MRSTARRYTVLLLVAVTLLLPTQLTSSSEGTVPPMTAGKPFLDAARAQMQGRQALDAIVMQVSLILYPQVGRNGPPPTTAPSGPVSKTVQASGAAASSTSSTTTTVVVREGQTLWMIAQAHGVSVDALADANGLQNAELIHPGQRLIIPSAAVRGRAVTSGSSALRKSPSRGRRITVVVEEDQTLWEIAQAYEVPVEDIVEANGLRSAELIRPGQRLLIPGATAPAALRLVRTIPSSASASIVRGFEWPARGVLRSRFGWRWRRHHDGIDIAAPYGTPVSAAKAGRVIFAGWYYAYGRTVIIDHDNGVTTLYGHNSKLLVRIGQVVEAGMVISRVGSSGRSTGPHVHFEIRVNGRPINPLKYL